MNSDFKHLLKLLDDDNEQAASLAMAELIQNDDPRLERVLRSLQETPDAKLRRRIHQMQSAIIKRRNRRVLAEAKETSAWARGSASAVAGFSAGFLGAAGVPD